MCGIVGYISKTEKSYKDEKAHFMRFALALDTLRGQDSTGLMTLTKDFKVDTIKSVMPGDRFVQSPRFQKAWTPGWAQVGHNRAATIGKVNVNNAHPFIDGPIALVHNGTLWAGGKTLPKVNQELEVDSMQLAHNFAQHEPSEAAEVLSEIDGAFAIIWFDRRDGSVNMARNSERPLHYAVGKSRDIMWFMSDGAHLSAINKSLGNRVAAGTCVFKLDKHIHLKWKKGDLVPEVTPFDPFVIQKRPTPAKPVSSGKKKTGTGNDKSALERATSKWENNVNAYNGRRRKKIGYPLPTVHLGGRDRLVPRPMLDALKVEYDLDEFDYMRFIPKEKLVLGNKHIMVMGEVEHRKWGNCIWNAVVTNATSLQVQAYMNQDWLVRPVGIAHPWDEGAHSCPSIMVHVEHCSWETYLKEEAEDSGKEQAEEKESDPPSDSYSTTGFVLGPQQIMLPVKRAESLLENGCISCGYESMLGELSECQIVNEGRDLLCAGCVIELKESIPH